MGAVMCAGVLSGCAAIAEGTLEPSQTILFTSTPSGALVKQGPRTICSTPCRATRNELRLAEGFQFQFASGAIVSSQAEFGANGAVFGNILFGGGVGLLVDAATGRLVVRDGHVHVNEVVQESWDSEL
jgi:hypothetical protein